MFLPLTAIQIKRNLIEKAKLKKEYARQKAQTEGDLRPKRFSAPEEKQAEEEEEEEEEEKEKEEKEKEEEEEETQTPTTTLPEARQDKDKDTQSNIHHTRRQKIIPFAKEHRAAQRSKREAEERQLAREKSLRERHEKIQERERFRHAMAKARSGGKNGQRKLGRESQVLLDRVRRMVEG
jgi:hypothetical protein